MRICDRLDFDCGPSQGDAPRNEMGRSTRNARLQKRTGAGKHLGDEEVGNSNGMSPGTSNGTGWSSLRRPCIECGNTRLLKGVIDALSIARLIGLRKVIKLRERFSQFPTGPQHACE